MRARRVVAAVLLLGACDGDPATTPASSTATPAAVPPPTTVAVPDGEPGSVVEAELIELDGVAAYRTTYLSEAVSGGVVEVTGLVLAPEGPPPEGGWPVVAWAHGTTGGADACAPSFHERGAGVARVLGGLTYAGYVVAATDYEGLGGPGPHPYLDGRSAARSMADAVHAARALVAGTSAGWVAAGHSQGGHAALWAAQLAPSYAPDLDLLGAVAVAPVSALERFPLRAGGAGAAFAVLLAAGFLAAEPDVDPSTVLTEQGLAALELAQQECVQSLATLYEAAGGAGLLQPGATDAGTPFGDHLRANEPGRSTPSVPLLVLQGEGDDLTTPAMTAAVVERLCDRSATVELRSYAAADHSTVLAAAEDDARAWIAGRFERPPPEPVTSC